MKKRQTTRNDESSYDGEYPYVQVTETPAGHQWQVDNTPGSERVFFRHKKGTYIEISDDGSSVVFNVGDSKIYNKSGLTLTTDENGDIKIGGHGRLLVGGGLHGEVAGDSGLVIGGDLAIAGMGKVNVRGQSFYFGSDGSLNINVQGAINIKAGGDIKINGATIRLNE